jgi:hypothetical protein
MITVDEIKDTAFETLIKNFDESIDYLKTQFNIELKTYGNFLRIVLNNIQPDSFNNLIEKVNVNRELERALDNIGGYTIEILGENNPKTRLSEIINHIQQNPLKFLQLIDFINRNSERKTIIADTNDIDYLLPIIRNPKIKIISLAELKRNIEKYEGLVFYSFNGKKDFDFIYNLLADVSLVLYAQEHQLYNSQVQKRKHLIEEEVRSIDRQNICGIFYEPSPELPIRISRTIEGIVNRIDNFGKRAYENYKEETDTLLEEIEEKIIYRTIFSNHKTEYLESNENVFDSNGDLIKVYRIKVSDKVRIYPREQFAEKLYQVAVDTDKVVFGKVEEDSKSWLAVLTELKQAHSHSLYPKLKANGIRVLPATVESYFNGHRKFPMFNNDLKAIFKLRYPEKEETEIDLLLAPIRKSKSTYNSTMIALGRGIKQEIKLFLKEKRIGEILTKLKFTSTTLQTFIDEYMPLSAILGKEVYQDVSGQLELNFIQQLEL